MHPSGRGRALRAAALLAFAAAGLLAAAAPSSAAVAYNTTVNSMVAGVTQAQLQPVVDELSGVTPTFVGGLPYAFVTRASSSGTPIDMAEQYVYEHLLAYGLSSVAYQAFSGKGGSVPAGRNVIGQIGGSVTPGNIVIVGCHMDDRPWPTAGPVAPGADDDASGVSANLYLARAFAGHRFADTIRFVFFGDEENAPWTSSSYGSGYYAAQCKAAGEKIVAMIQADALAWNGTNNGIVYMNTRAAKKDPGGGDHAIVTMWQQAAATYAITGITPTLNASGDNLSDHGSFWANGYPAVMLIEDDVSQVNPNWHTANDKVSTFRWPYYVQMTRSLVAVAAHEAGIIQ
ncbi:MAG: M20/M25/M40 family metallo-hydrolase [Actinomycetes bacterium]